MAWCFRPLHNDEKDDGFHETVSIFRLIFIVCEPLRAVLSVQRTTAMQIGE